MKPLLRTALIAGLATLAATAHANDYPTADRVLFVQDCMRANPGPYYEMLNKCSCAIDQIAEQVKFDEYTEMVTISNGMTIGGERGGAFRDVPTLAPELKKYREVTAKAKQGCFIKDPK